MASTVIGTPFYSSPELCQNLPNNLIVCEIICGCVHAHVCVCGVGVGMGGVALKAIHEVASIQGGTPHSMLPELFETVHGGPRVCARLCVWMH